jgi:hypothetical protein
MPVVLRGQKTEFIGVQVRIEITLFGGVSVHFFRQSYDQFRLKQNQAA